MIRVRIKIPAFWGILRRDYAHSNTLRFEHGSLKTSNTARALAPPSGTSEVRMVSPSRRHRVGVAMASLPFKRVGVFGSSGIFRNLIPVGCRVARPIPPGLIVALFPFDNLLINGFRQKK